MMDGMGWDGMGHVRDIFKAKEMLKSLEALQKQRMHEVYKGYQSRRGRQTKKPYPVMTH